MAERGARGGGRGRGRGRGMTLEQLGVQKGELLPEQIVGPPETYPPLEFHPIKPQQEKNLAESYLLVIKKEFREHMQNSQFFIQPDVVKPDIERYSDRYQVLANNRRKLALNWSRFPKELNHTIQSVNSKKRTIVKKVIPSMKKARLVVVDISETLEVLEKKEAAQANDDEEDEGESKVEGEVVEELEVDEDEELDDGTDYVNNYFDNGEDYAEDEDDALDEGGVF